MTVALESVLVGMKEFQCSGDTFATNGHYNEKSFANSCCTVGNSSEKIFKAFTMLACSLARRKVLGLKGL